MIQDAENWELLQELFYLAEETPEADRERVLTERCPDEGLRRRAMKLVTATHCRKMPRAHARSAPTT
jgi:hypothetical protein